MEETAHSLGVFTPGCRRVGVQAVTVTPSRSSAVLTLSRVGLRRLKRSQGNRANRAVTARCATSSAWTRNI